MHIRSLAERGSCSQVRRILLLGMILLFLAAISQPAAARDVRIALQELKPSLFTDENGEPAGFMVDLVRDIAAQHGWTVIWVHGTYRENLDRLAAGDVDLVMGLANTTERVKIYDFSHEPVLSTWTQVYARPGSGIETILDLDGKNIAVLTGDANNAAFRDYAARFGIQPHYVERDNLNDVLSEVQVGNADAAVTLWMPGEDLTKWYGLSTTPVMFSPVTLVCAVPKGKNADLLSSIDSYLVRQKNDPSSYYTQTMHKWFGEKAGWVVPPWVLGGLIVTIFLVCLFVIMSLVLRHEVRKKTAELSRQNTELQAEVASRKRAEDELVRKNDELQAAYEELTATEEELRQNYQELRKSEQKLLQARKKLNLLNALIIQEVKSRIFSLAAFFQLARTAGCNGKAGDFLSRGSEILQAIEKNLAYAKKYQDLGLSKPRWQRVNHTLLTAISHLDLSSIARTTDLADIEIYADPLLEDVFFTLMDNVISHGKAATAVDIRYRQNPDRSLTLLITDNGPGIPAADKEKIFTWEYRGSEGSGLFLAREILSITGIAIAETGEPGSGARFEITVPEGGYRFGSPG